MAKKKKKDTYKVGRDAETGQFIPVDEAKRRKKTAVVETMKKSSGRKKATRAKRNGHGGGRHKG